MTNWRSVLLRPGLGGYSRRPNPSYGRTLWPPKILGSLSARKRRWGFYVTCFLCLPITKVRSPLCISIKANRGFLRVLWAKLYELRQHAALDALLALWFPRKVSMFCLTLSPRAKAWSLKQRKQKNDRRTTATFAARLRRSKRLADHDWRPSLFRFRSRDQYGDAGVYSQRNRTNGIRRAQVSRPCGAMVSRYVVDFVLLRKNSTPVLPENL